MPPSSNSWPRGSRFARARPSPPGGGPTAQPPASASKSVELDRRRAVVDELRVVHPDAEAQRAPVGDVADRDLDLLPGEGRQVDGPVGPPAGAAREGVPLAVVPVGVAVLVRGASSSARGTGAARPASLARPSGQELSPCCPRSARCRVGVGQRRPVVRRRSSCTSTATQSQSASTSAENLNVELGAAGREVDRLAQPLVAAAVRARGHVLRAAERAERRRAGAQPVGGVPRVGVERVLVRVAGSSWSPRTWRSGPGCRRPSRRSRSRPSNGPPARAGEAYGVPASSSNVLPGDARMYAPR